MSKYKFTGGSIFNASSSQFIEVSTSAVDGSTFVEFESIVCSAIQIDNGSEVDILVQKGGSGPTILIPSKGGRLFVAISNANELAIKREDDSDVSVTVSAEALIGD